MECRVRSAAHCASHTHMHCTGGHPPPVGDTLNPGSCPPQNHALQGPQNSHVRSQVFPGATAPKEATACEDRREPRQQVLVADLSGSTPPTLHVAIQPSFHLQTPTAPSHRRLP